MEVPVIKNRLLYALAAFAVSPAMGCVIVSSSDDTGTNGNGNGNGNGDARGQFDVIWKVSGLDASGDGCTELPGADSVEVVSQPLSGGTAYTDIYNCEAGGGITALLPLGNYEVWANVRDQENRLLAQSQVLSASLTSDGQLIQLAELGFLNAQFEATWALTEDITEQALTCDEVVAGGISFVSTLAGSGGTAFDDIFPCPADATEGDVETAALPLGDYTISVSLLEEETDEVLGQAEPKEGTLETHHTEVDLGVFDFRFAPEGGHFRIFWDGSDAEDSDGDGCHALRFDENDELSIEVIIERTDGLLIREYFSCDGVTSEAVTGLIPLGDYDIYVNVVDAFDRIVGSSLPHLVEQAEIVVPDEEVAVPAGSGEFVFFHGQFDASWRLFDSDGGPTVCEEDEGVSILSTLANSGGTGFDDIFNCIDGEFDPDADPGEDVVTTHYLPLGDYLIDITLVDSEDNVIGDMGEGVPPLEETLEFHALVVNLGIIDIFLLD
jgi:hypothetical protein